MPSWLGNEVAVSLASQWGGAVERTVFGDGDERAICERVDAACRQLCDAPLVDGFLYTVSVGCVFGCVLADGRRVVLKAYQPRWTPAFLSAVRRVQAHLFASGFPCPEPLGPVAVIDGTTFVAETERTDPGPRSLPAEWAAQSAGGLARLVQTCLSLAEPSLADHPLRTPHDGVFPEPHSPIFDFAATAHGAEWIDDVARSAVAVMAADTSVPVIAHTDWSARNIRIDEHGLVAVYDWDSLALVKESEAVGIAAATWSKTGEPEDATASAEEIDAYLQAYEDARGTELTGDQRRATRAAAVRGMAYTARCEHAIDRDERVWTTTRARLRTDASRLLER